MLPRKLLAGLAILLASPALLFSAPAPEPDTVQQVKSFEQTMSRTVRLNYLVFLPRGYDAKSDKKWPTIFFLHGSGERGTNAWLVATHGPPKIVREKPDFPFIVISPQCPPDDRWHNDELLALLDDVTRQYAIDSHRIYLTGLSMGGFGSWSLGVTHPERFAALAPICGGGERIDVLLGARKKGEALKSLPVWAFHGAKDPAVPVEESQRMVEALKKIGCQEVKLTIYPDAKHDSWTETYNNPALYDWLLQHRRD